MRLPTAVAFCLALALFMACGDDDDGGSADGTPTEPPTPTPALPHVRGAITVLEHEAGSATGSIRVEGELGADTVYPRAVASFGKETEIVRFDGEIEMPATADDLAVGLLVEVTLTGPVGESDPVQGTAGKVVMYGATYRSDDDCGTGGETPPMEGEATPGG